MGVRDELAAVLANGLFENGAGAGSSIHSWRCEHPDRYGKCSCVEEVADDLSNDLLTSPALARLLDEARREAWRDVERLADQASEVVALKPIDPWDRGWRQAHRKFESDLRELLNRANSVGGEGHA